MVLYLKILKLEVAVLGETGMVHIQFQLFQGQRNIILVKLTIVDLLEQRMCYLQKVLVIIDFM
mgnify:CR=1 FL=1